MYIVYWFQRLIKCFLASIQITAVTQNVSDQLIVTLHNLSVYPSVHKQLIPTIFDAYIVPVQILLFLVVAPIIVVATAFWVVVLRLFLKLKKKGEYIQLWFQGPNFGLFYLLFRNFISSFTIYILFFKLSSTLGAGHYILEGKKL